MPSTIAVTLKAGGVVSDRAFDQVYPADVRALSRQHWTPVRVAMRAATLLTEADATSILDVGSGPGKFCIVGALTTGASFVGVERRPHLVDVARAAAARCGVRRVRFSRANIVDFDFSGFDGFYLFNPFFEQLGDRSVLPIDGEVVRSRSLYRRYVKTIQEKLATARPGTAVVTFYGFGGNLPDGFERVHTERAGGDRLVLWRQS